MVLTADRANSEPGWEIRLRFLSAFLRRSVL